MDWNRKLINAAENGDNSGVQEALDHGAHIHAENDNALRRAAVYGHTATVALLLARGADIHAKNDEALRWAAERDHTATVALLLDRGAEIHAKNDGALQKAAQCGQIATVALLLDRGAYIHADNDEALRWAAVCGHTDIVALLLDRGADIHAKNDAALRGAAEQGHSATVALLLDRDADIHADNDSALRGTAQRGHTDIVALLLDRGADIHANNDGALRGAAHYGHSATVALLLDRGADINADDDFILRGTAHSGYTDTVAILKAFDALEIVSRAVPGKMRPVIFQAAAIGAACGMNEDDIAPFAAAVADHSLKDTELSRVPAGKALDPLQVAILEKKAQPDRLSQAIGVAGYLKAGDIKDMVRQFADCVLLPRLLLEAGVKQPKRFKRFDEKRLSELSDRLMPLAAQLFFTNKRLDEIVAMSDEWHIPGNAIPDKLRPLRGGKWQPLIPDTETPITHQDADGKDHSLVIRALSSQEELSRESNCLKHCVGSGGYSSKCMEAQSHILSVQTKEGIPLATVEVSLTNDPRNLLHVEQFRGMKNGTPPKPAQEAFDWFQKELADGRIHLLKAAQGKWGKIKQDNEPPPLLQRIGFEPTRANTEKCLEHLITHLKIKEPLLVARRSRPGLAEPRSLEKSYRWVDAIDRDVMQPFAQPALQEQWDELKDEARKTCGGFAARAYALFR